MGKRGTRTHIFWQKRIREGDGTTKLVVSGEDGCRCVAADRIVLPIPPGKHWSDELPILIPTEQEIPKLEARNPKQVRSAKQIVCAPRSDNSVVRRMHPSLK